MPFKHNYKKVYVFRIFVRKLYILPNRIPLRCPNIYMPKKWKEVGENGDAEDITG